MSVVVKDSNVPLTERLRPQRLQDLTLPEKESRHLQKMFDTQTPMHMLFYGPPGSGKSSAGRIFVKARGPYGTYIIDGSLETGIENVRTNVERFASTMPFTPGLKICFIDEADYLSSNAQASLRGVIERFASSCRFIMTANDIGKLMPAIRSRLLPISFYINVADRPAIVARMQVRLAERLRELEIPFDAARLNQIVATYFPDLRQVISQLDYEFCYHT